MKAERERLERRVAELEAENAEYKAGGRRNTELPHIKSLIPMGRTIPKGYRFLRRHGNGAAYMSASGLSVIFDVCEKRDRRWWMHLSIAGSGRLPAYDELKHAKAAFMGDRRAIQVFPSSENHVNIHPYCLHLFACLGDDGLPEFSGDLGPGMRSI